MRDEVWTLPLAGSFQVRPPSEVVNNYEAIKAWMIDIGIAVAVLVGVITLLGIAYTAGKKWWKRRKENP